MAPPESRARAYCLGSDPNIRFGSDCIYALTPETAEHPAPLQFLLDWIGSAGGFVKMHRCLWLPLMYLFGILCIPLKLFLLNPPCMRPFLSRLFFEAEVHFPGANPAERMRFAQRWYSTEPRDSPYVGKCCDGVSSRFTYLEDRHMWMERMALFRWLALPVMCASAFFDASAQKWVLFSGRLMPHALVGCIVVGEKPDGTGWMIKGNLECWIWLVWLYKWLVVRILGMYAEQMEAIAAEHADGETADLEETALVEVACALPLLGRTRLFRPQQQAGCSDKGEKSCRSTKGAEAQELQPREAADARQPLAATAGFDA